MMSLLLGLVLTAMGQAPLDKEITFTGRRAFTGASPTRTISRFCIFQG